MTTRGGKRPGAGRKPANRNHILYARVSKETFNKISYEAKIMKKSISEYIEWLFNVNYNNDLNNV